MQYSFDNATIKTRDNKVVAGLPIISQHGAEHSPRSRVYEGQVESHRLTGDPGLTQGNVTNKTPACFLRVGAVENLFKGSFQIVKRCFQMQERGVTQLAVAL